MSRRLRRYFRRAAFLLALSLAAQAPAALALATAAVAQQPATGQAFLPGPSSGLTPGQRQEVVQILRETLRSDPSILRDALMALQVEDLRAQEHASRTMITARRDALLADPADPVAGDPRAQVSVVYFYDTRCPYCRRMHPTLSELLRAEPQGVRVVFKDLPILGPASTLEARALLAAARQGGYARLQDAIMRGGGGGQPTRESLRAEAGRLGLDGDRLLRDMDDPAIQARLDGTVALARELQIQGTPAIVVGDKLLPGAVDLPTLRQAVAEARKG